jgi:hypothetical protein
MRTRLDGTPAWSASHHVRNALQILKLYSSPGANEQMPVVIARQDLAAIERRLNAALIELQAPIVLSAESLQAFLASVAPRLAPDRCAYCGCTEDSPCELAIAELSDADRASTQAYYDDAGIPLPATTPCWWLDVADASVCTNPSCQAAYADGATPAVTP